MVVRVSELTYQDTLPLLCGLKRSSSSLQKETVRRSAAIHPNNHKNLPSYLLIGDKAMQRQAEFRLCYDLAFEWVSDGFPYYIEDEYDPSKFRVRW